MDIKNKYNAVINDLYSIDEELKILKENDIIKRYEQLKKEKILLENDKNELYKIIKNNEYDKCHHLLINTYVKSSGVNKDNDIKYCGCLKCGLDEKVKYSASWFIDYDKLPLDSKIMLDYLNNNPINKNNGNNILCNLELARAIYNKILEHNPKINDKLALKYLDIALDNIRNIKMTENRKQSRIKRLGLNKDFNSWNN